MKKIIILSLVLIIFTFFSDKAVNAYGECDEYGYMAMYDGLGSCKCMSGYVFGKDFMGKTACVSGDTICHDKYGYSSRYDSLSGSCECSYGYVLGKDSIGRTQCISETESCQDQYGYNSRSTYGGKCECSYGYIFNNSNQCEYGNTVCSRKHGTYASYDSLSNSCECDSGYTLDEDNQCVKKQNNAYFKLLAIDESSDSIIVQSDYSKQNYLLEYGIGCGLYIDRYLDKNLVINLGTDFDIDMFDKIVLQDHDVTCSIMSYDFTSDDSFEEEEDPIIYTAPTKKLNITTTNNVVAPVKPKPVVNKVDTQVKKETATPDEVKVEQKEEVAPPVNPEPVKKIPWYKKFFNWLF